MGKVATRLLEQQDSHPTKLKKQQQKTIPKKSTLSIKMVMESMIVLSVMVVIVVVMMMTITQAILVTTSLLGVNYFESAKHQKFLLSVSR